MTKAEAAVFGCYLLGSALFLAYVIYEAVSFAL